MSGRRQQGRRMARGVGVDAPVWCCVERACLVHRHDDAVLLSLLGLGCAISRPFVLFFSSFVFFFFSLLVCVGVCLLASKPLLVSRYSRPLRERLRSGKDGLRLGSSLC